MPPGSNNLDGGSVSVECILKERLPAERQQIGEVWYQKCDTGRLGGEEGSSGQRLPKLSRRMFWCSSSGYLAARWHNGRLPHSVFAGSWRCCSVKAVSAAELDTIDAEMPSLAAADHERSDRDNVHDRVQAMLRHAAMAVCQDAASTRRHPDAGIATTWLFNGHIPERVRLFRSAGRRCDSLRY